MGNVNLESNNAKELQFDSKAVKVEELEEKKRDDSLCFLETWRKFFT